MLRIDQTMNKARDGMAKSLWRKTRIVRVAGSAAHKSDDCGLSGPFRGRTCANGPGGGCLHSTKRRSVRPSSPLEMKANPPNDGLGHCADPIGLPCFAVMRTILLSKAQDAPGSWSDLPSKRQHCYTTYYLAKDGIRDSKFARSARR